MIKSDFPSSLMDLSDTFMVEKLAKTYDEAVARFELQKKYLSVLGTTLVFLVNGNHDGEYDWLTNTLAASDAAYKFVFIHNMVGGIGKDSRGGMEAAQYFEWGGSNADGSDGFAANRSGWAMPIHDLLVKYDVTAVFHGHDHFYAKQEKDGIVYQMAPQPGTPGNSILDAGKFGYESGTFLPSAGYLRVHVAPSGVTVEYVQVPESGSEKIADSYTISG